MKSLNLKAAALALSSAFAVTYALCVIGDALLGWQMYRVWSSLFPGFAWNQLGIAVGFVESIIYGIYAALVFGAPYNFFRGWFEPVVTP